MGVCERARRRTILARTHPHPTFPRKRQGCPGKLETSQLVVPAKAGTQTLGKGRASGQIALWRDLARATLLRCDHVAVGRRVAVGHADDKGATRPREGQHRADDVHVRLRGRGRHRHPSREGEVVSPRRGEVVAGARDRQSDVDAAVVEGASARVRPLLMTVATTVLGLLPLLWESGVGADVSARTAAPVVGGLWSCMVLTLLVLPAAYAMWRRRQIRQSGRGTSPDEPRSRRPQRRQASSSVALSA